MLYTPRFVVLFCLFFLPHAGSLAEVGEHFVGPDGAMVQAASFAASGDFEQAASFYRQAARKGNVEAQYQLGEMYRRGQVDTDNWVQGSGNWLKKAATKGHLQARASYGLFLAHFKKGQDKARKYLRSAADQGLPQAQYHLALHYLEELYKRGSSTTPNNELALNYAIAAAENGIPDAQRLLAYMYFEGRATEINPVEGAKWTLVLAEQGDVPAQATLGRLFAAGKGVAQDWVQAREWYVKAAGQGNAESMQALARIYAMGQGVDRDDEEANAWSERAGMIPEPPVLLETPRRKNFGAHGWVMLDFTVTQTGDVTDVSIIHADPPGDHEEASLEAAAKFKYKPAMLNGEPVKAEHVTYCMTWLSPEAMRDYRLVGYGPGSTFTGGWSTRSRVSVELAQDYASLIGLCFEPN